MMSLELILQLIGAAMNVYAAAEDRELNTKEKALVSGLPTLITSAKALLSTPAYASKAQQLALALDNEEIRKAIGAAPAPDTTKG